MRNSCQRKGHEARKGFSLAVLVSFAVFASACAQAPDCRREDVFCAALITNTLGLEDYGFNQDVWAGLMEAKTIGLADRAAYIESVDTRDYQKNFAYFAERGYDLIVTTGAGMQDETLRAADLHPDSVFVGVNQTHSEPRPNLIAITFPEDQMGFLAGVLAARLTKTGVVAGVCETSGIDSMWRYCEGFRAGAEYANESVKVHIAYRDEGDREKLFIDEEWGYDTAKNLIFRGADVIFAAGGATGQGALRAATEAGLPAIGVEQDQAAALGESGKGVVTSILGRAGFEVQEVMRALSKGHIPEGRIGQIGFTPLPRQFPESLTNEMNDVLFRLWLGEIRTNVPLEKP